MIPRPCFRADRKTAHLVEPGDPYALCGRPAGNRGAQWSRATETPPATGRCSDCDRAMHASNPRPYDVRHWWRV